MPTTLRQSVQMCRELGYRFLWIDALCIVQDDPLEWKREALEMGNIYQHSTCTIAATGAKAAEGGLFFPREDEHRGVVAVPFKRRLGAQSQGQFFVQPIRKGFFDLVQSSTWNSRGWILQERLLSRRVLHFSDGQTFFECQRYSTGEDKVDLSHHSQKRWGNEARGISADWSWCLLVEDYTKRHLTQATDKLYALTGLATDMAKRREKRYCAGVWTEMLEVHLLWYGTAGAVTKPPTKRAPSWSWASVDGPLIWEPSLLEAKCSCKLSIPTSAIGLDPSPDKVISIPLTFQGYIAPVRRGVQKGPDGNLIQLMDPKKHPCCYTLMGKSGGKEAQIGWVVFDRGDFEPGPFFAARISDNEGDDGWKDCSYNVLLLTPGRDKCFTRVGIGEIIKTGFFAFSGHLEDVIQIN
jgi:hypothetical protein